MPPPPPKDQDREKDRRRLILLTGLLFLVVVCLVCATSEFAAMLIEVDTSPSIVFSRLSAEYGIWDPVEFAPVDPSIIAAAMQDRGLVGLPGVVAEVPPGAAAGEGTSVPGEEGDGEASPTATATPPGSQGTTITPSPTATIQPTPTEEPTPTDTPIPTDTPEPPPPPPPPPPTDTPVPGPAISGVLRHDRDYDGGSGTAAGVCDDTMRGVRVELHRGTTPTDLVAWTTTDSNCAYLIEPPSDDTYVIRVDAGTFNGPTNTLPEQTFANGASALGGQDPDAPDDHWVQVSFTGVDVPNVDFGFSYEAVVNENPSGQGSLEQAIINANLIGGANTIVFAQSFGPYTITPGGAGFSALTGAQTTIDGTMTTVTLDGAGQVVDGLTILATNVTLDSLTVTDFGEHGILIGNGSAGVANNATIQNCAINLNDGSGIWVNVANEVTITGCALVNNINPATDAQGQIDIHGSSANGTVDGCVVRNDLTINGGGADGIRIDSTAASGWTLQNNEVFGHRNGTSNEGIVLRGTDNRTIGNTIYNNYRGLSVYESASDRNLISRNSIYSNTGAGINLALCPVAGGPNECRVAPTLSAPGPGRTLRATFNAGVPGPATVEFFRSENLDAAGEGMAFCFDVVDSDLDGIVQVNLATVVSACGAVNPNDWLTATLIDATNNTSAFATNFQAP